MFKRNLAKKSAQSRPKPRNWSPNRHFVSAIIRQRQPPASSLAACRRQPLLPLLPRLPSRPPLRPTALWAELRARREAACPCSCCPEGKTWARSKPREYLIQKPNNNNQQKGTIVQERLLSSQMESKTLMNLCYLQLALVDVHLNLLYIKQL